VSGAHADRSRGLNHGNAQPAGTQAVVVVRERVRELPIDRSDTFAYSPWYEDAVAVERVDLLDDR
jgi:hypothetical protein